MISLNQRVIASTTQSKTKIDMHLLTKRRVNTKFVICQDQQLTSKVQNINGKNDLAQLAKGVHSLCQNKNAHSLGLKSHLKRLQFHTMFDVCMTISWIECLFLRKPSTPSKNISSK